MTPEKLVLVERFEELKTGMRIAWMPITCGCKWHVGVLLGQGMWPGSSGVVIDPVEGHRYRDNTVFRVTGGCSRFPVISKRSVNRRRVFRFASDLDIDDELAREENPYTSRSVVGTGGRDEVRTLTKERTR